MEPKYYQGMLRKHQQLQSQLDRWLDEESHVEAIKEALDSPALNDTARPQKASPELTLLWELRQTSNMLDIAEQALNLPSEQHRISGWERFLAALRSLFSIEKNPADRPVEELRDLLSDSLADAEKAAAEPGSRLDYSPTEFCSDPKIVHNDEINMENNPRKIRVFLDRNRNDLSSSSIAHLEHRIKACQKIEKLEKNTTYHPPTQTYTATRNGQPVEANDLQPGDKIMLNGVHERRSQNTLNGCWSVSFCSQLEYRGVNLTQEEIRAYRPNTEESPLCLGGDLPEDFSRNQKQSVTAYFALAARTMPNAVGHHFSCTVMDDAAMEKLRRVITRALTVDNSPLCLCARGHYRTIVGIEGDRIYFKNPLRIVGQPETVDSMTFEEMRKLGSKGSGIELAWFKDLKPTLSGGIQPDAQLALNGVSYTSGQLNTPSVEADENENTIQRTVAGEMLTRDMDGNDPVTVSTRYFLSNKLSYNRLPGGGYNADALDEMMQTLSRQPGAEGIHAVRAILEHTEALKNGVYQDDPTAGMLELARLYQSAIQGQQEDSPLKQTLLEQLAELRDAVAETVRGRYQTKMGDPEHVISSDDVFKGPKTAAEKKLYNKRRERYDSMNEGMAGMLYVHTLVRDTSLTDSKWIDALQGENVKKGVEAIRKDNAFDSMFHSLYDNANKYQYYVEDLIDARNNAASTERKAAAAERAAAGKQAEKARLKAQIEGSGKSKEKTPAQLRAEADEAKRWLEEVEKRDPVARKEFLEKMGLSEELHLNPYTSVVDDLRHYHPDAYRERNEILRLDVLRKAMHSGDATELYSRYMKHQHKLMEQEKKSKDPEGKGKEDLSKESNSKEMKEQSKTGEGIAVNPGF